MYPNEYRYSKSHEWILEDGDTATIGITNYAQEQLGDIVFLELPEENKQIEKDEVFGTVESVKAVSELYAPLSGEVIEVNQSAVERPELLNEDPHKEGWLIKVRFSEPKDAVEYLTAEEYQKFTEEEAGS